MKSWISFLLPDDEYKEKKMLQFFSEGAILLFLSLVITLICSRFMNIAIDTALLLHIGLFLFYVYGRYIISGIEFTDIATERAYQKELKAILAKAIGFTAIFIFLYSIMFGLPVATSEWLEILGFPLLTGFVMFFTNFISLRLSYNRNKELA